MKKYSRGNLTKESLENWIKDIYANNKGSQPQPRQFWPGRKYLESMTNDEFTQLMRVKNVQLLCGTDVYNYIINRCEELDIEIV